MKAHVLDSVKNACRKLSATIAIIPDGFTKKMQPLNNIAVYKSFKNEMSKNQETEMSVDSKHKQKGGNMQKSSFSKVVKRVADSRKISEKKDQSY